MGVFSDGHAPSSTWDALLSQVDNGRPAGVQLDPVGLTCPGRRLWHENASGGGSQLSPGGHCGVLNQLERLTLVKYCRLCFGVGKKCRCSNVPHQTPSQASALWMPPTMSYVTMASSTETTASSSVVGYLHRDTHHQDCLQLTRCRWICFRPPLLKTYWPLLVSVGAVGD